MKKVLRILTKTGLTIAFPLLIFVVMLLITRGNGIDYYVSENMARDVLVSACLTSIVALAIWVQLKNGRFDFSGGATMILATIIAGNIASRADNNAWLYLVLCLVLAVVFNLITATVYLVGRLPIVICTIGMTLLYESLTYIFFKAQGLRIMSQISLTRFGRLPDIFIPFIAAFVLFVFFSYFTKAGRESKLLASNQKAAVSIGINEKKNVLITYLVSGLLLGLAAVVYGSQSIVAPQSGLSTSGTLFANIVPVFIGLFLGRASIDALGILAASFGMGLMTYGLECLGLGGGGWQMIILGIFMLAFYTFSSKSDNLIRLFKKTTQGKIQNRRPL